MSPTGTHVRCATKPHGPGLQEKLTTQTYLARMVPLGGSNVITKMAQVLAPGWLKLGQHFSELIKIYGCPQQRYFSMIEPLTFLGVGFASAASFGLGVVDTPSCFVLSEAWAGSPSCSGDGCLPL